jgi:hypothetical protein
MADLNALMVGAFSPAPEQPLNRLLSMDDITAAGRSIRRPTTPTMGPLPPPTLGERVTGWLADLGLPRWQAERVGAVVPYTPPGGAYDAGQVIGAGIEQGSPAQVGLGAGLAIFGMIPGPRLPASLRATARHRFSSLSDAQLDDLGRWITQSYDDFQHGVHGLPEDVAQSALRVWPSDFGLRLDDAVMSPGRYARASRSLVRGEEGTPLGGTSVWGIPDIEDPRSVLEALQRVRTWANRSPLGYRRLTLLGERSTGSPSAGSDAGELLFRNPLVIQQWRVGRY